MSSSQFGGCEVHQGEGGEFGEIGEDFGFQIQFALRRILGVRILGLVGFLEDFGCVRSLGLGGLWGFGMGPVRWRRGRRIMCALAFMVVLSLPALCVAAASPAKKAGSTILLFLGSESDEGREDGSLSDSEDVASENVPTEVEDASPAWDEFSESEDSQRSDEDLDPGSWSQVLEQPSIWDSRNKRVCNRLPEPMVHTEFDSRSRLRTIWQFQLVSQNY